MRKTGVAPATDDLDKQSLTDMFFVTTSRDSYRGGQDLLNGRAFTAVLLDF